MANAQLPKRHPMAATSWSSTMLDSGPSTGLQRGNPDDWQQCHGWCLAHPSRKVVSSIWICTPEKKKKKTVRTWTCPLGQTKTVSKITGFWCSKCWWKSMFHWDECWLEEQEESQVSRAAIIALELKSICWGSLKELNSNRCDLATCHIMIESYSMYSSVGLIQQVCTFTDYHLNIHQHYTVN